MVMSNMIQISSMDGKQTINESGLWALCLTNGLLHPHSIELTLAGDLYPMKSAEVCRMTQLIIKF
jgi:hypothetical protein